jgi:hypothetical protein
MPEDALRLMGRLSPDDEARQLAHIMQCGGKPGLKLLDILLDRLDYSSCFDGCADIEARPFPASPHVLGELQAWVRRTASLFDQPDFSSAPEHWHRAATFAAACLMDPRAMRRMAVHARRDHEDAQADDWEFYAAAGFKKRSASILAEWFLESDIPWGQARSWMARMHALRVPGAVAHPEGALGGVRAWIARINSHRAHGVEGRDTSADARSSPCRTVLHDDDDDFHNGVSSRDLEMDAVEPPEAEEHVPDSYSLAEMSVLDGMVPGGPSLRVLDQVGDIESAAGVEAAERFRVLLGPMPLRQAGCTPGEAYHALREEFPWMEEANVRLAQTVALCALGQGWFRCPPMLLLGPPGIGKTRWARRASEVLSLSYGFLSLSGIGSSMGINGSERGWSSARPSFAALALARCGSANPLLVLDELDKAGTGSQNGNPHEALMPMLESETACSFPDAFLLGNLDLSRISWIATANSLEPLSEALISRFDVVRVGRPSLEAAMRTVPRMVGEMGAVYGISACSMPDVAQAQSRLVRHYEAASSLRGLRALVEAEIRAMCWQPPGPRALQPLGEVP